MSQLNSCGAELRDREAAGEGNIMNKEEGGELMRGRGRGEKWRDSKMLPSLKLQNERSMGLFKCAPRDERWLVESLSYGGGGVSID